MTIIITGGTGMIGTALAESLARDGYKVICLSRSMQAGGADMPSAVSVVRWDGHSAAGWGHHADGADAIVNLAGDNLSSGRWTAEKKKRIIESRVNAGQAVVEAVVLAGVKPKVVIQASGVNYYGVEDQGVITEECPAGNDFLARVCQEWENATAPVEAVGVRRVISRSAVVLSRTGGALPRMAMPFKLFIGGPVGSGRQWFPWIHLKDVVGAFRYFLEHEEASGAYNLSSPNPVRNSEFGKALAKTLNRPYIFPAPAFLLKLLFGEMSTVLLDGAQVVPKRLLMAKYRFFFSDVESALGDIYQRRQ